MSAGENKMRCQVHDLPLVHGTAPILYGLLIWDPDYGSAQAERFPNARSSIPGGCLMCQAKEADVWYCPECRVEEKNWLRGRPLRQSCWLNRPRREARPGSRDAEIRAQSE